MDHGAAMATADTGLQRLHLQDTCAVDLSSWWRVESGGVRRRSDSGSFARLAGSFLFVCVGGVVVAFVSFRFVPFRSVPFVVMCVLVFRSCSGGGG